MGQEIRVSGRHADYGDSLAFAAEVDGVDDAHEVFCVECPVLVETTFQSMVLTVVFAWAENTDV